VIFGTGNPNPDLNGSTRAGINLYTDSIVALDVHNGKLRWYYQKSDTTCGITTRRVTSCSSMSTPAEDDPAAGQAGKTGWFYIVNRATGALIRRSQPFVLQNKNMFGVKSVLPGANGAPSGRRRPIRRKPVACTCSASTSLWISRSVRPKMRRA